MDRNLDDELNATRQIIHALLENTYFRGFYYYQFFTLQFSRVAPITLNDHPLPMNLELRIFNRWRLYSSEWSARTSVFPPHGAQVYEDAVLACELVKLKYNQEPIIQHVGLSGVTFSLAFKNGHVAKIPCESEIGEAWSLYEQGIDLKNAKWCVSCEEGYFDAKKPD